MQELFLKKKIPPTVLQAQALSLNGMKKKKLTKKIPRKGTF